MCHRNFLCKWIGILVWVTLPLFGIASGSDTVLPSFRYIFTGFGGATPADWRVNEDGSIVVSLIYDHQRESVNRASSQWLFQLQADSGSVQTVILENFDNIWNGNIASAITDSSYCIVSSDVVNWSPIPAKRIAGNKLKIQLKMPGEKLYLARLEPYSVADLDRWLDNIRKNGLVNVRQIGKTVEGRPLEILRIGDPGRRNGVFLRARAHGFETGGNWAVKGLVQFLLSNSAEAKKILDEYCLYILPMANKDAVASGKSRFNAMGYDLNRGWEKKADSSFAPENFALESWLDSMISKDKRPALAIDLHNDGNGNLHISPSDAGSNYERNMLVFESLLRKHTWFTGQVVGGGQTGFRNPGAISDGLQQRYAIDAMVLELNYEWIDGLKKYPAAKDWMQFGEQLAVVLYDYFRQKPTRK